MSPTVTECLEHARQCEWYAARTNNEADRKFLARAGERAGDQSLCAARGISR